MGHDYSYSQPDSSDEHYVEDDSIDNERDALIRMDEGETSLMIQRALHMDAEETRFILAQNSQYPPQPEVDFGIPKVCYCGGVPILSTAYHNNARGRMYFTCNNVEDGEMHIHKWWEEAVMEEMRDKDRLLEVLSSQVDSLNYLPETESEDKIVKLEKAIGDLVENINRYRNGFHLVIGVIGFIGLVLASFVYWGKMP